MGGSRQEQFLILDWYHRVEGRDLPEELSIPLGRGPGPVDDDHVGIMGHHFCYCTRLCPLTLGAGRAEGPGGHDLLSHVGPEQGL